MRYDAVGQPFSTAFPATIVLLMLARGFPGYLQGQHKHEWRPMRGAALPEGEHKPADETGVITSGRARRSGRPDPSPHRGGADTTPEAAADATPDEMRRYASNLPPHTTFVEVAGGNHRQFGYYRYQLMDGRAGISREEQQRQLDAKFKYLAGEEQLKGEFSASVAARRTDSAGGAMMAERLERRNSLAAAASSTGISAGWCPARAA